MIVRLLYCSVADSLCLQCNRVKNKGCELFAALVSLTCGPHLLPFQCHSLPKQSLRGRLYFFNNPKLYFLKQS